MKIKFRSWDWTNKTMDIPDNIANDIDGDVYKLMQFTGLLDKRGKEIYEGDIIKRSRLYQVGFDTGCFCCDAIGDRISSFHLCRYVSNEEYEVIGNIYENKELLEVR